MRICGRRKRELVAAGIENDVRHAEGVRLLRRRAVFTRTHEEVEGQAHHVNNGAEGERASRDVVAECGSLDQAGQRNGLDSVRRRVSFDKGLVEARKSDVETAVGV